MKVSSKILNSIFSNKAIVVTLLISALLSFLIGIALFSSLNISDVFFSIFISDFVSRSSTSFIKAFFSSLISNSLYIIPLFLSSMSFLGVLLPHLLLSYYSFSISLAASFLYSTYNFSGILYFLVVLLPDIFIFFFCLFSASYITFEKSFSLIFSKDRAEYKHTLSVFVKSFSFIFALTLASSLISGGVSFLFANLFNF